MKDQDKKKKQRSHSKTSEKPLVLPEQGHPEQIELLKKTMEQLRENKARLRALIDNLPFDVWARNRNGICTMQNSVSKEYWGDHIGHHPDEIGVTPEILKKWRDNNSRALSGEVVTGEVEYAIKGEARTYFNIIAPIREGKEIIGTLGVNIDITDRKKTEDALQEALKRTAEEKSKSEAILEAIGDAISIQDTDYKILYQNKAHKNLVGDHAGKYCYEAYNKRDSICLGCPVAMSFKDGRVHIMEKKGSPPRENLHVEITASPLKDSTGKIIAGIEAVRNITERKKTEEALKESEKRYRTLVDNTLIGVYTSTLDGRILYVNKALAKMLGFDSPEELMKEVAPARYKEPKHRDALIEGLKRKGIINNFETEMLKKTGEPVNVILSAVIDRDTLSGVIVDITERKTAEKTLMESELRYRTLAEAAHDMIFIIGSDDRIQYVNTFAAKALGFRPEELINKKRAEFFPAESDRQEQSLRKVFENGEPFYGETETTFQNRRYWINTVIVPLKDETGKINSVLGISRDITERKKMEVEIQKAQKLESLGILAGGIAHDFNNILTAITGNISLAKMYAKPGLEVYDLMIEVEKAALRAKHLTTQLLTFSKGGAPVRKITSVSGIIKDAASFALSGSKAKCEISIPETLWSAEIDEGQISHVIHHLIINAQQAMPEGGTIKVTAANTTVAPGGDISSLEEGEYIKITVVDHGIGIPEEHLQKIFDPYFTTKQEGSGLGLATAYSVIKKHGGNITADSKLGFGTTFTIYLPASKEPAPDLRKTVKPASLARGMGRVLVMDDEDIVRLVLGRMIGQCGYEVEFAEDGEKALDLYKKAKESGRPFNAVILDLIIPGGMGGKETMKKLLEIDPDVKAIVSSGYSDDPVMAEFRDYGFKDALAKPYEMAELQQALHKAITSPG